MDEEWKEIPGYDGKYFISNLGRVKSVLILKNNPEKKGYPSVKLSKDNVSSTVFVHRLVAKAFIPKVAGSEHVNHKDSDRTNAHVSNLEWCTPKENSEHSMLFGKRKLIKSFRRKLTKKQVRRIVSLYNNNTLGIRALSRMHDVSPNSIRHIIQGKSYKDYL